MEKLKPRLKHFFYQTGTACLLDKILFQCARLKYHSANRQFRQQYPHHPIPPDYFLYETYLLDYRSFCMEGQNDASEIYEWACNQLDSPPQSVLDWGCGVGRLIHPLHALHGSNTRFFGCDINTDMIEWDRKFLRGIDFRTINYAPPTPYHDQQFDLVYGISVFTHIDSSWQTRWLKEIGRILRPGGIFLFTTHGSNYFDQLLAHERAALLNLGVFTKTYRQKGHRMMTTYHHAASWQRTFLPDFHLLEWHDGAEKPGLTGGQDLWILKKSSPEL